MTKRILLGVTAGESLVLLAGFPEYLAQKGWDVHVVSNAPVSLETVATQPGVHRHQIRMARKPSLKDVAALVAWIRLLRDLRPDVVSVGTPKAGLLGMLASRYIGVPHRVYMLRGLRLETMTGASRAVSTATERVAMMSADVVLSVSHSLREAALRLKLTKPSKIRVVGSGSSNGIDTSKYRPNTEMPTGEVAVAAARTPVIGFVGRINEDKGLRVLAAALEILATRGVTCRLLIVGGDDNADAQGLFAESSHLVTFLGHVKDPERCYHAMSLLCLPSYREGFPNVLLEAASSGIPVVASDATGCVDAVVHEVTGLITPVGDAPALADCIDRLISSPELALLYGLQGRSWVKKNFSRPVVWGNYLKFYDDLVQVSVLA